MKATGYLVMEFCEYYEQALALVTDTTLPPGGILDWTNAGPVAMFASRSDARGAIDRTEHYRLAYGRYNLPEKKLCRVVPIAAVPNACGEPGLMEPGKD